jgi:hypothetical protein
MHGPDLIRAEQHVSGASLIRDLLPSAPWVPCLHRITSCCGAHGTTPMNVDRSYRTSRL